MNFFFQIGDVEMWDDSDDEDGSILSQSDVQSLTSGLNKVLYHLLIMLDHFSLKRSRESMEVTVQELVDLTHMETSKQLII